VTHHLQEQPTPANSSARASLPTMQRLFDAFLDVSAGRDLDETLRHIVQAAVELIDAQYGTLGVLDQHGVMVTFVHVGPDPEQPPEPRPLRSAPELSTDPARETVSFLSVPVRSRGEALGTLYLTAKRHALFSTDDDIALTALAAAAGVAIANAVVAIGTSRAR